MKRVDVADDTDSGTTSVTFTFDSRNARELEEVGALLRTARAMTPDQAWLGTELDAHLAYFSVLERSARGSTPTGFRSSIEETPVEKP